MMFPPVLGSIDIGENLIVDLIFDAYLTGESIGHSVGSAIRNRALTIVAVAGLAIAANAYSAEIVEAGINALRDNLDANSGIGTFINENIVEFAQQEDTGILATIKSFIGL